MAFVLVILLAFAFVLCIVAGWGAPPPEAPPSRWKFLCFGLACWILAEIVARSTGLPVFH